MPQWAGSCWYYLRFISPHFETAPWDKGEESYWMPVDLYVGGAEHAVLHLLYARFWHHVLFDMGWVSTLGVRRPWRRKGLGLALLQHSFGEFHRRGKCRVGLGVDADSLTGATRLYEKAGMEVHRQYASYEKELRAGVDLSTQSMRS